MASVDIFSLSHPPPAPVVPLCQNPDPTFSWPISCSSTFPNPSSHSSSMTFLPSSSLGGGRWLVDVVRSLQVLGAGRVARDKSLPALRRPVKASWEGVGVSEGCPFCVASAGPPATQSLAPKGLIQSFIYALIHPFPGFFVPTSQKEPH